MGKIQFCGYLPQTKTSLILDEVRFLLTKLASVSSFCKIQNFNLVDDLNIVVVDIFDDHNSFYFSGFLRR